MTAFITAATNGEDEPSLRSRRTRYGTYGHPARELGHRHTCG